MSLKSNNIKGPLERWQFANELHGSYNTSYLLPPASIQKRLKKEKKAKRKLQEALEFESKRRERVEDALKHSSSSSPSPEPLHAANNNNNKKNGLFSRRLLLLLSSF